jgi:peptidoglycan/LPS O-acetylase OafA/YrhL
MLGFFRLLLAYGVFLSHLDLASGGVGRAMVSAFFLVSGYLITLTLVKNYDSPTPFYWNRFLRIYPLHLVTLAGVAVVATPSLLNGLGALALIPAYAFKVNAPAWSLGFEILFYLIAPLIVYQPRAIMSVLGSALLYLAVTGNLYRLGEGFMISGDEFTGTAVVVSMVYFMTGALLFYAGKIPRKTQIGAIALTIVVVYAIKKGWSNDLRAFLAIMAATFVMLLSSGKDYAWSKWAGELCYPLYLIHWPIIAFYSRNYDDSINAALLLSVVWVAIEWGVVRRLRFLDAVKMDLAARDIAAAK